MNFHAHTACAARVRDYDMIAATPLQYYETISDGDGYSRTVAASGILRGDSGSGAGFGNRNIDVRDGDGCCDWELRMFGEHLLLSSHLVLRPAVRYRRVIASLGGFYDTFAQALNT